MGANYKVKNARLPSSITYGLSIEVVILYLNVYEGTDRD